MNNETIPDTIEKLYERLDDYDKQQLFNYGYLLEYTRTLENEVKVQNNEVTRLHSIIKEVREYILTNKLYCFKYDDEELFEITTDKKAKDELLKILDKGETK